MFTCGLRKGISILDCAWRWILHWALPPCTSPVNHWGEEHYSFFLKRFFWANECVFVNNTLINWGFASRTVATKHTWSSNAGCKDLCITPASPFLVILGTAKYRAESHKARTVNTANSTFWWNLQTECHWSDNSLFGKTIIWATYRCWGIWSCQWILHIHRQEVLWGRWPLAAYGSRTPCDF